MITYLNHINHNVTQMWINGGIKTLTNYKSTISMPQDQKELLFLQRNMHEFPLLLNGILVWCDCNLSW